MKIIYSILIFSLVSFMNMPAFAKPHSHHHKKHSKVEKIVKEINNKLPCKNLIFAKDIGKHGFVITKPGYWCLAEDVKYNPRSLNPAIRISASNVTLDLNGHTLSQKNKILNVIGIVVDPGLTTVTLKNGTVRDFSMAGIQAGTSPDGTPPFEGVLNELAIYDINALNNGTASTIFKSLNAVGGIFIANAQDVVIENTKMNENFSQGLAVNIVNKITLNNCHCDDNLGGIAEFGNGDLVAQAQGAVITGVTLSGIGVLSNFITITNCTFNNNIAQINGFGLSLQGCQNSDIDSCQMNGNGAICDDPQAVINAGPGNVPFACGIEPLFSSTNLRITNCQINGTFATINPPPSGQSFVGVFIAAIEVHGIFTSQGSSLPNIVIDNCQVDNTSVTLNTPINSNPATPGFDLIHTHLVGGIRIPANSNNASITNCQCSGNIFTNNSGAGVSTNVNGFLVQASSNTYFANCQSCNHTNVYNSASTPTSSNPSAFLIRGFQISNDALLENCFASGNTQAAPNLGIPQVSTCSGFQILAGNNLPVILRNCVASRNSDTFTSTTGLTGSLAAGFLDINTSSGPVVLENCVAEFNTSASGTDVLGTAGCGFNLSGVSNSKILDCKAEKNNVGILLGKNSGGNATQNTIVQGNIVSENTLFGIRDETATTTNAYYSNSVLNNAPNSITTNYSSIDNRILPTNPSTPGTPILQWTLGSPPDATNNNGVPPGILDNISING